MQLEFFYVPTRDLAASVALYRDGLGMTEVWREGETTVALRDVRSGAQVMLDASDDGATPGPIFLVEDVSAFHADRPQGLEEVQGPSEIPGGFVALYRDPSGLLVQVMDQSTEDV
ncbi:VOC family protein [Pseudokineococcus sp. 1T1Z-3]|uniref:VOC family protein n=1 Tax=Pseudokineococcus sp. 1T1Z-3 TaxID=3132745 RepID=UPI0030A280A6